MRQTHLPSGDREEQKIPIVLIAFGQWKRPKFDPLTDLHKNWQAWLRPGRQPACKI